MSYIGELDKYKNVKSNCLIDTSLAEEDILISICIPTYRREISLIECLKSIYNNTDLNHIEIIVCDNDTETNMSSVVIKHIINCRYTKIRYYVNSSNIGMTGNWNRLITLSRGKYIAYLHDDDLLADFYTDSMIHAISNAEKDSKDKIGFIKASFTYFENDNCLPELHNNKGTCRIKRSLLHDSIIKGVGPTTTPTCGMVFNRNAISRIKGFSELYYPCSDHILGFVLQSIGYYGYITTEPLSFYRWSINESLRPRTQIETCKQNYKIRQYFYKSSLIAGLFGIIFNNAQYSDDINGIIYSCEKFNIPMDCSSLEFRSGYHKKSFLLFLLHVLKKLNRIEFKLRKVI